MTIRHLKSQPLGFKLAPAFELTKLLLEPVFDRPMQKIALLHRQPCFDHFSDFAIIHSENVHAAGH